MLLIGIDYHFEAQKAKKSVYPLHGNDLAEIVYTINELQRSIRALVKAKRPDEFNSGKAMLEESIDYLQQETDKADKGTARNIIETVTEKARDVGHKISSVVEKGIETIKKI